MYIQAFCPKPSLFESPQQQVAPRQSLFAACAEGLMSKPLFAVRGSSGETGDFIATCQWHADFWCRNGRVPLTSVGTAGGLYALLLCAACIYCCTFISSLLQGAKA